MVYRVFNVPTTTSLAIAPVNNPTVACQLSACTPIGRNSGVISWLTEARAESLMLLTGVPCSEKLVSVLRKRLTMMMTLPARRRKPFRRCQVWIIRLLTRGA
ncbi:hypothetical protein D3C80_1612060 [compost metagenome]